MELREAWYLVKITSQNGSKDEADAYQAREIVQEAIGKYEYILLAYERLLKKQGRDPNSVPPEFFPNMMKDC